MKQTVNQGRLIVRAPFKGWFSVGFSLIEMLVVLAIITLLTAMGTSQYQRHLTRAARQQAQTDLLAFAAQMELHRLSAFSYKGAAGSKSEPRDTGSPWLYSQYSPSSGAQQSNKYKLLIEQASDHYYLLQAEPLQPSLSALRYSSLGERFWDKNNNGLFEQNETCWRC